jgi:hypothetical protein
MSDFAYRWELRWEPNNGTVIVSFIGDGTTWRPLDPVVGNVRWYRDDVPFGPVLDGIPVYKMQTEQLPSGATITKTEWME